MRRHLFAESGHLFRKIIAGFRAQSLDPFNPAVNTFYDQAREFFFQHTGDPAGSRLMSLQALENLRQQQASSLAYFDVFWMCAALGVGLALLVLLMKRSVAEKGAHVGAE